MIAIHYFASIRESLDCDVEKLDLPDDVNNVDELLRHLISERGEVWGQALGQDSLMIAVNQEMTDRHATVKDGDEVAFFPPVTGG
ncbi:MAG: molybdopterin converting factor subunit 1 [Pseudohongiellaceae bacterium]|jgi:molybdopterin synthase sulfur carrier subunit